jgi:hypothetical protein
MDPNERLKLIRTMAERLLLLEDEPFLESRNEMATLSGDLAQQVKDLDDWLTQGGYLPEEWKKTHATPASV